MSTWRESLLSFLPSPLSRSLPPQPLPLSSPLLGLFRGPWSTRIQAAVARFFPLFVCQAQLPSSVRSTATALTVRKSAPPLAPTTRRTAWPLQHYASPASLVTSGYLRHGLCRPRSKEAPDTTQHIVLCFWSSLSHLHRRRLPAALLLDDKVPA
ncbi:hypothetical protein LX32DRAFT_22569 [Colletotrichum zoysiae]|uniref:Uncharacterized protein n=1 Tax=Colletotrichum zoysiae TaxID=1216348 RepID=A0AAD9HDN5_9PEZI|nr:hypothetical protein LX32DRAFT_22569 [Colletotrichum zoysiae]